MDSSQPDLCPLLLSRTEACLTECMDFCVKLKTHTHTHRCDLLSDIYNHEAVAKLSALGKRWDTAEGLFLGIIVDCQKRPPSPYINSDNNS